MKAPRSRLVAKPVQRIVGDARPVPQALLLGSIRLFQIWISPIDGPRCRFSPTCSQFGYQAIKQEGPVFGVMMTADRLMRCNHWTDAGDYIRLRHGALHDPVEQNLLSPP